MLPLMRALRRFCCVFACGLLLLLTACSAIGQPPRQVLLEALDLQVRFTQSDLAQALQLPVPEGHPNLRRVRVEQQHRLEVEGLSAWQLQGRVDWSLPDDPIRIDSPFDVVLLPGERGESWRLLRPPGPQQAGWRSYPLVRRNLVVDATPQPG